MVKYLYLYQVNKKLQETHRHLGPQCSAATSFQNRWKNGKNCWRFDIF